MKKFANQGDVDLEFLSPRATIARDASIANEQGIRTLQKQIGIEGPAIQQRQAGRGIVEGLKSGTLNAEALAELQEHPDFKRIVDAAATERTLLRGEAASTAQSQGRPLAGTDAMIKSAANVDQAARSNAKAIESYFGSNEEAHKAAARALATASGNIDKLVSLYKELDRKLTNVDLKQKSLGTR